MSTETKRLTISRPEFFTLCTWMQENREKIEALETYAEACVMASAGSKINASMSAVRQAMESVCITLKTEKKPEDPLANMAQDLALIASELVRVMGRTNMQLNPALLDIAGRQDVGVF